VSLTLYPYSQYLSLYLVRDKFVIMFHVSCNNFRNVNVSWQLCLAYFLFDEHLYEIVLPLSTLSLRNKYPSTILDSLPIFFFCFYNVKIHTYSLLALSTWTVKTALVTISNSFTCIFCRSYFVHLYFFFWSLCFLFVLLRYTDSDYSFGIFELFLCDLNFYVPSHCISYQLNLY
jgi:hypothetical protein